MEFSHGATKSMEFGPGYNDRGNAGEHSAEAAMFRRVGRLEDAMARMSEESVRTQSALSTLAQHIDGQGAALEKIAEKLDEQRTKRPELGALAAWALVLLALGGAAVSPMYSSLDRLDKATQSNAIQISEIRSSRFDRDDGDTLRDLLIDHLVEESRQSKNK